MAKIIETRELTGFTEVSLRAYGDLSIEQDAAHTGPARLVVEADESLMPKLAGEVRGGRLVLGLTMPWYEWITFWFTWIFLPDKGVRYRLTVERIEGLSISGAGSIDAERLRTEECRLRISGSGKMRIGDLGADSIATAISGSGEITLIGAARRHEIRISGSGRVDAHRLDTRETTVKISGSGRVSVNAVESLEVRISGSGEVRYAGQPAVSQRVSGSGSIRQARQA